MMLFFIRCYIVCKFPRNLARVSQIRAAKVASIVKNSSGRGRGALNMGKFSHANKMQYCRPLYLKIQVSRTTAKTA